MRGLRKFWVKALGLSAGLLLFGTSCERELSDSIEPVKSWRRHFLQDGETGVDLRSILYVELGESINPDSANANTVKLYQASGSPLLAGAIATGAGAEVPGRISVFNLESGRGAYLAFDPLCDLYPLTDYRLELIGLLSAEGNPMPDLIFHFTTGPVPADYPDPFYCDELVLPLLAYDLSDLQGITGGLADDPLWNSVAHLVAVGVLSEPPLYQNISDPQYYFGYSDSGVYTWSDNKLTSPPYTVLVYINNNGSGGGDLDLSLTPGWFNLRPFQPTTMLDSFTAVAGWTSSDPANTPVALETTEYFEGASAMKIGVALPASLNDSVSRAWAGGFPAGTTGIMLAFKMGNVSSGDASFSRLELQLRDGSGNIIASSIELAGVSTNWGFLTRALPEDFTQLAGAGFEVTTVDRISLVIVNNWRGNDLVGDLFVDFLTIGDLPELTVYYPPLVITPNESLPLYVDEDGSTYWAYARNGLHVLNLDASGCFSNCPLLSPEAALTPSNLAQAAP